MKLKIYHTNINEWSFSDVGILSMKWQNKDKGDNENSCKIEVDSAWYDGKNLPKGILNISDWKSVSAREYDVNGVLIDSNDTVHTISLGGIDELLILEQNTLIMRGFSTVSGLWTEIIFNEPNIVEFSV